MKGNLILGIGLLILSMTLIVQRFTDLPDVIYLVLLSVAIVLEFVGVVKIKNENKR